MRKWDSIFRMFYTIITSGVMIVTLIGCASKDQPNSEKRTGTLSSLKVFTLEEGYYEISLDAIVQAGMEINKATLGDLILLQRGSPVNYWVDDIEGKTRIRFYSPPSKSRYSIETITIFTRDKYGIQNQFEVISKDPMPEVVVSLNAPDSGCYIERILEENISYQPKALPGEPWLWSTITAPGEIEIPIDIEVNTVGDYFMQLNLWASTEASESPDHKIVILLNGSEVSVKEWDGQGWHTVDFWAKSGAFINGINILTIKSPGLSGVIADKVSIDWLKIKQPVDLDFIHGQTKIQCISDENLLLKAVSSQDIYLRLIDGRIDRIKPTGESGADVNIQAGQDYWFIEDQDYRKPSRLILVSAANLQSDFLQPAEYLVIGERDLLEAAKPLIDWRQTQGLIVRAIPVDFLYDYFNGGYVEPEAIRSFIYWTSIHWPSLPRYILLLGDASYDPKGYQTDAPNNRLPSFLIETRYGGETASDYGYSIISAGQWPGQVPVDANSPQIAVGRFPAQTPEQVRIIVEKIIAYEEQNHEPDDAESRILIVADNQEASFILEGKKFLHELPLSAQHQLISPESGSQTSVTEVLEFWQAGYQWIIYFGHGSIHQWGTEQYLDIGHVGIMPVQTHPPIVFQFTCLSGLFTHPEVESLSESLLWKPDGGAIALLAPTSLTVADDQHFLSQEIAGQMSSPNHLRLGDVLLTAWQKTSELPVEIDDVLRTFVLLGDPGLVLP